MFLHFNAIHHGEFQESVNRDLPYRPEIDGLRGVAVLGVILFHLDRAWLPGGFVGVDVFFVISGYLITSILVRGLGRGSFSFANFYQRRIARLFPALIVMLTSTVIVSKVVHTSWDHATTAAAFSASLLSIANIHQWIQGDYFAVSADAQPLLHCWSLSVEEQFYLVFPLVLWSLMRMASPQWRYRMIGLVGILSFAVSVYWRWDHPPSGFYLLPARAWELLVGSGLSLRQVASQKVLPGMGWLGLALILGAFLFFHEGPHFPGWIAAFPVVGTALIVADGNVRFLRWTSLVKVGRASYSLYLWHWPVFAFVDYTLLFHGVGTRMLLKVSLTSLFTWLSYRFIESPCRHRLNEPTWRFRAFALLAAVLVILGPLGYALRKQHYIDGSDGPDRARIFDVTTSTGTLVLIGDSQATMYGGLLRGLSEEKQLRFVALCQAGKDPLIGSQLWETTLAQVQREAPSHLVLAVHGDKLLRNPSRLRESLSALAPHVGSILLITMPPEPPASASPEAIRRGARPPFYEETDSKAFRQQSDLLVRAAAENLAQVLEIDTHFVSADGALIVFDAKNQRLFYDKKHLSYRGTMRLKAAVKTWIDLTIPLR